VYAVIRAGGKQYRVTTGERIRVERLRAAEGEEVSFRPLMVVDGAETVVGQDARAAAVSGRVIGEVTGPKIVGFTYKPKTNQRRRWGHRQRYTLVEITSISRG